MDIVVQVADEVGASAAQVALGSFRHRPGVVIPIVGARRLDQLQDHVGVVNVDLGPDQLARLDAVSANEPGIRYSIIDSVPAHELGFGGL